VKAFTEALQHELRNTAAWPHQRAPSDPGFRLTGLTAKGRSQKPAGAWTPEQTIDFMIERIDAEISTSCVRTMMCRDALTSADALGPPVTSSKNRPALSRWHPDYAEAFAKFVKSS